MVFKIKWQGGGESASRFSTRKGASEALGASRFKGRVVKAKLGNAGFSPISKTPLKWSKRKTKDFGLVYTPRAK